MISAGQGPGKASPLFGTCRKSPQEAQGRHPRRLLEMVTSMGGQGGKGIHIYCC